MVTESTILCVPCGHVFSAETDDEVVRMTMDHARQKHDTILRPDDLRPAIKRSTRAVGAPANESRRMHQVIAGGGPCVPFGREKMNIKLATGQSGGELTVVEAEIEPQDGPPLHVHTRENEAYYVLEGEFEFVCGNDTFRGGPGTFVHSPREIPHRYQNVGNSTGRLLFNFTPAGIEAFFTELHQQNQLNPELMTGIARKYGITIEQAGH